MPNQSRAARAAMLIKWLTDDADWNTADLHREVVSLLTDTFPADALAAGALENAAMMLATPELEGLGASVVRALSGDAVLTESPHDQYPIQVIRGRQGGKLAEMEARIQAALETPGDGCIVVASVTGTTCRRHGGSWPHK